VALAEFINFARKTNFKNLFSSVHPWLKKSCHGFTDINIVFQHCCFNILNFSVPETSLPALKLVIGWQESPLGMNWQLAVKIYLINHSDSYLETN
jgi:hypothetical protein